MTLCSHSPFVRTHCYTAWSRKGLEGQHRCPTHSFVALSRSPPNYPPPNVNRIKPRSDHSKYSFPAAIETNDLDRLLLPSCFQNPSTIDENRWNSMKIDEKRRKSMKIDGNQWNSTRIRDNRRTSVKINENPWKTMENQGKSRENQGKLGFCGLAD